MGAIFGLRDFTLALAGLLALTVWKSMPCNVAIWNCGRCGRVGDIVVSAGALQP
jgi:hypothetical protein